MIEAHGYVRFGRASTAFSALRRWLSPFYDEGGQECVWIWVLRGLCENL